MWTGASSSIRSSMAWGCSQPITRSKSRVGYSNRLPTPIAANPSAFPQRPFCQYLWDVRTRAPGAGCSTGWPEAVEGVIGPACLHTCLTRLRWGQALLIFSIQKMRVLPSQRRNGSKMSRLITIIWEEFPNIFVYTLSIPCLPHGRLDLPPARSGRFFDCKRIACIYSAILMAARFDTIMAYLLRSKVSLTNNNFSMHSNPSSSAQRWMGTQNYL